MSSTPAVVSKLEPADVSAIAGEVAGFIQSNGIKFERGAPEKYFLTLGFLCDSLTLPLLPRETRRGVVLLKNYCNLWNILVDDEIDREGGRSQLDESMHLLLERSRGKREPYAGASAAARTLDKVLAAVAELPAAPHRERQREVLHFDLWEEMNGFVYEYCSSRMRGAANELEYGKYSTMTASLKHFLDLDCLFAETALDTASYRQLRMAYEHYAVAVKLASDLGTLRREILEEDSLGMVRILAVDSGVPLERVGNEQQLDALFPRLRPAVETVRRRINENLESAEARLARVPGTEVDTEGLKKSLAKLVESYFKAYFAKGDLFFEKK